MNEGFIDINEAIEQALKEENIDIKEQTDAFKENISHSLEELGASKVTIDLVKYKELILKAADLDRILRAILKSLKLNYSKDGLSVSMDECIADTIKALYPDAYDGYLKMLLAAEE